MPFEPERELAPDVVRMFGEYLTTFISNQGQVRADLFRRGGVVKAYVSFPTGFDAGSVTDSYFSELWDYAREHDFRDQFKLVYS